MLSLCLELLSALPAGAVLEEAEGCFRALVAAGTLLAAGGADLAQVGGRGWRGEEGEQGAARVRRCLVCTVTALTGQGVPHTSTNQDSMQYAEPKGAIRRTSQGPLSVALQSPGASSSCPDSCLCGTIHLQIARDLDINDRIHSVVSGARGGGETEKKLLQVGAGGARVRMACVLLSGDKELLVGVVEGRGGEEAAAGAGGGTGRRGGGVHGG